MNCKWGHPVATLPGDEGDKTSLSQKNANSANQGAGGWCGFYVLDLCRNSSAPGKRRSLLVLATTQDCCCAVLAVMVLLLAILASHTALAIAFAGR
eukprot:6190351-Pleurochrysis_carterae.AAC.1